VELVVETLLGHDEPVAPAELHDETGLSDSKLTRMLDRLEDACVIASNPDGSIAPIDAEVDPEDAAKAAVASQKNLNRFAQSRVEMMRAYAELEQCRRAFLLNYFGEAYDPPCGHCDNCRAGHVSETPSANHPFPINSAVIHEKWGEGRVMRHEGETMIVLFETVGYRTLDVALVQSEGLLRLADESQPAKNGEEK
jgi:ATP-dependent DNA helicase RecQ